MKKDDVEEVTVIRGNGLTLARVPTQQERAEVDRDLAHLLTSDELAEVER